VAVYLCLIQIVLERVLCPYFKRIHGNGFAINQPPLLEQFYKAAEHGAECFCVVFPKVGNGLVFGALAGGEPHCFEVQRSFTFKLSRGADIKMVTIEVKFHQHRGVERGAALFFAFYMGKTKAFRKYM
jgi:hypothetical protein